MELLLEVHNLETTPCLGCCASVQSCLPSPVLLFSCNATTGHASISLLALGGRGRAAYSGTVFVEMHRHSGVVIPPLLQQCPLVHSLHVLLQVVVCCPSSSASLRSETASSLLKVSAELSHLKCRGKQLWDRQPKACWRKKEWGRGGKVHK